MKALILTYVLTYGGAMVALSNPFIGLLIYICFAIVKPSLMWSYSVPQGDYSLIIGIATFAGWLLKGGQLDFQKAKPIVIALVCYWAWLFISYAFNAKSELSWYFVMGQTKIVLPVLIGVSCIESLKQLKQLAWTLALSQAYFALRVNEDYLGGTITNADDYKFAAWDNNGVALFAVVGVGTTFFLALYEKSIWRKVGLFAGSALMAHVPMILMSRGSMLALAATGVVGGILMPKRPIYIIFFMIALAVGVRLAGPSVVKEFGTTFAKSEERDGSSSSRVELWEDCWDCMLQNPLFGVGPGRWREISHTYGWPIGKDAHSTWMRTAAELGVPGLTFFVSFFSLTVWSLWRVRRQWQESNTWFEVLPGMVILPIIAYLVGGAFISAEGMESIFYTSLLGIAAIKVAGLTPAGVQHNGEDSESTNVDLHTTAVPEAAFSQG